MESKIRLATLDDLNDVQTLSLALFKKEYADFDKTLNLEWTFSEEGEKYFKEHIIEDKNCVFVAYADDKIVGYLAGGLSETSPYRVLPGFAELKNMFVQDTYRSAGIGTRLYQAFTQWCKSKGVGRLRVVASAQNVDGIKFYRKNGFVDYDLALETNI